MYFVIEILHYMDMVCKSETSVFGNASWETRLVEYKTSDLVKCAMCFVIEILHYMDMVMKSGSLFVPQLVTCSVVKRFRPQREAGF